MNIFPLRRRDVLSELKLPVESFEPVPDDEAGVEFPQMEAANEPMDVSPANELATALVERDIADAVRADNPPPPEPEETPAPLSRRHLETIERMVAHLKSDERSLEKKILDAQRQLADTQLARRGYEKNAAELHSGISVLIKLARTKPSDVPEAQAPIRAVSDSPTETPSGDESQDAGIHEVGKEAPARSRRKVH
jgi:hypothetical protein